MAETMRAFRAVKESSGSLALALEILPTPKPTPNQVLVKVRASAIQPSDVLNAKGTFSHTTFPRTLGRDFAGTVVDGPQDLLNKDVFGTSGNTFSFAQDGAHAEYAAIPVDGLCLKPKDLSFVQAALIGVPCSTALQILERSKAQSAESVVVLGGNGAVGSCVSWLARARSCKVITVGRHGTDIDSTKDTKLESVAKLTNGKGADVIVDTVGDLALLRAAIDGAAVGGRIVTITAPRSGSTELTVDQFVFYRKELSLLGCNTVEYSQAYMTRLLNDNLLPLIPEQLDKMPKLAGTEISIEQAEDAYNGKVQKAVIVFD